MQGWASTRLDTCDCLNELAGVIEAQAETTYPQVAVLLERLRCRPSRLRRRDDARARRTTCTASLDDRQRLSERLLAFLQRRALVRKRHAGIKQAVGQPCIRRNERGSQQGNHEGRSTRAFTLMPNVEAEPRAAACRRESARATG